MTMEENRCMCCGGFIPEGRMFCPECEETGKPIKAITKAIKEYVEEYIKENDAQNHGGMEE